jgi:hypothetical protein
MTKTEVNLVVIMNVVGFFVCRTARPGSLKSSYCLRSQLRDDFYQKEIYEDRGPISDVFVADGNGVDEIYIIMTSAGSGSYGTVLASDKDNSLSMIHFPKIEDGDLTVEGYRGHDTFRIEGQKLVRVFPIYNPGDTSSRLTGGVRTLVYGLYPGEAMWQLKIERIEMLNDP